MNGKVSKLLAIALLLGTVAPVMALKPGLPTVASDDRFWQIVFVPKTANKGHTVEFWRTRTAGKNVELSNACDPSGSATAIATGNPDGSWKLDAKYGNLNASLEKNGKLKLRIGNEEYGTGERISTIHAEKCVNRLPTDKIVKIQVAASERTFAAGSSKCCWNRAIQSCFKDSDCDPGGEGCVASMTPTKKYGAVACDTKGRSHLEAAIGAVLPLVRDPPPPALPVVTDPPIAKLPNGDNYACKTTPMPLSAVHPIDVPVLGTNVDVWPGALLQGKAYAKGNFAPITINRAKGTLTVTGVNFASDAKYSIDIEKMTKEQVQNGVRKLISQNALSTEAIILFDTSVVYNDDQLAYALGSDGRYTSDFPLHIQKDSENNSILAKFLQTYYTVSFEDPEFPGYSVFAEGESFRDLGNQIGPDNPPLYLKSVSYGRALYLLLNTPYDANAAIEALRSAKEGKADGTTTSDGKSVTYSEILGKSKYTYYVLGGDAAANLGSIGEINGDANLYDALKRTITDPKLAEVTQVSKGLPVRYTASYLTDQSMAVQGFGSSYNSKSCSQTPKKYASFNLTITCIDDGADVTLIAPDGKEIPVFSGGGNSTPSSIPLDGFMAAHKDDVYTLKLTLYNKLADACLDFQLTRLQYEPSISLTGLDGGTRNMVELPPMFPRPRLTNPPPPPLPTFPLVQFRDWGPVGVIFDYRIRLNRATGEVTVIKTR